MQEKSFGVRTSEREEILIITEQVQRVLGELTTGDGLCTIVVPHTTCAISVNENADPEVPRDIVGALRAMIPEVPFRHGEGNSDSHLMSMIIGSSLSWPYRQGRLLLGTWQGIYFIELDGPRNRDVIVYVV